MSKRQRDSVKEMGFGKLLSFNVNGIPSKLGHYVVDKFDPKRLFISTHKGNIKIDINTIHNLLGLPTGGIEINTLSKPDEYGGGGMVEGAFLLLI
ncbi:hypothetical protein R6Q57_015931 [Mikania cordata]